jgi:hypothetical protein
MRHRHHGQRHQPRREPGIIIASSCEACSHLIPGAEHWGDDRNMAIMHSHHAGELLAEGWIQTPGDDGVDDITCRHYHDANWEGGHADDCCGADPD